jgi:hypothetical protein
MIKLLLTLWVVGLAAFATGLALVWTSAWTVGTQGNPEVAYWAFMLGAILAVFAMGAIVQDRGNKNDKI